VIPVRSSHHLKLSDEASTEALAGRVAAQLVKEVRPSAPGVVFFLSGSLGAGKTTWVRGLLRALGHQGRVRSPSFTIMEPYTLDSIQIYHFDFYRFTASEEWREAGFDELIGAPGSVSLIEWPEMAKQSLAPPDVWMKLAIQSEDANKGERASEVVSATDNDEAPSLPRVLDIQTLSPVGENLIACVLNQ
jgi:tRNA threonylcarbamoyladenosine biosynthesis protein TsaE